MRGAERFMRASTRPDVQPKWVRVSDACKISSVGINKMYSLINSGRVKSVLLDGKRLIDRESIENIEAIAAAPPLPPGTVPMRRGGPGRPKSSAARVTAIL
jgi:hypothetical protein